MKVSLALFHIYLDFVKSRLKNITTNQMIVFSMFLIQHIVRTEQKMKKKKMIITNTKIKINFEKNKNT